MAKTFLTNLNLEQNELQNARVQNLASAPGTPVTGQIYYNTTSNKLFYWDGSQWVDVTGAAGAVDGITGLTGTNPVVISGSGNERNILVLTATTSQDGLLLAEDKEKLDNATADTTADTLVLRDGNGGFSATTVTGLDAPVNGNDAVNKGYTDGLFGDALTGITGFAPVEVTDNGQSYEVKVLTATTSQDGLLLAEDKEKLDNATADATADTLVLRDGSGGFEATTMTAQTITVTQGPVNQTDVTNKQYVDSVITALGELVGSWDASGGLLPTTGTGQGGAIAKGDYWYIVSGGTITGLSPIEAVNVGDALYAFVDSASTASEFFVLESNRDQATETVKGVAELATQAETNAGTNDTNIVTPLKLQTYTEATYTKLYSQTGVAVSNVLSPVTITHNLGTQNVIVSVYDNSTKGEYILDVVANAANTVQISSNKSRTVDVVVIGL